MGNKDYIHDIHDTFDGKIDSKEALKLANKIKSSQKLAYPNQEYKENLKNRLENMYIIDQSEVIAPRFSIYQIFGVLTSFVFIFGISYMLFDARQHVEHIIPSNLEKRVDMHRAIDIPVMDVNLSEEINNDTHTIKKESKREQKGDFEQEENIEETQIIQDSYEEIGNIQEITPENTRMLDTSQVEPENPEIFSDADFMQESESSSPGSASASMMMDFSGYSDAQEESFIDICIQHDGILSSSERYCIFPNGNVCEENDIYQCIENQDDKNRDGEIEIDLQELIEQYGQ